MTTGNNKGSEGIQGEHAAQQQPERAISRRPIPPTLERATTPPPGLKEAAETDESTKENQAASREKGEATPPFVLA